MERFKNRKKQCNGFRNTMIVITTVWLCFILAVVIEHY
jgi:hypothetical protein